MYRVLIVDDEKMIRMGMKNAIDWKKLGVDDVFTAASGNEALKILKEESPEIMVTDIQMTEMTGLELIKAARESVPELRVIVLTGFDNFEYARESLRLQVQDFFLKPIDEDDLFNAIEKQIKELKEQENKEQNQARVWRSQGSVVQMRLEQCMRNLVHTKADKEMQLYILQKDFQFDIKQKMSLILLEQPHFLYNTLECIHWQAIAEGNKEISTMVKALAKYYRICLSKGHDVITIREEVEHIRNYMIIQNMRYDNIIGSEIVVESQVEESLIPKLTLQPLVENSIYHGMKVKEGKTGTLYLTAYKNEDEVIIKVSDTGTGMSQEQIDEMNEQLSRYEDSFGYGVRNVNKRIELLFGEGYGLNYQKNDSGGVTVVIHLPYQTEIKKNTAGGEWTCV